MRSSTRWFILAGFFFLVAAADGAAAVALRRWETAGAGVVVLIGAIGLTVNTYGQRKAGR